MTSVYAAILLLVGASSSAICGADAASRDYAVAPDIDLYKAYAAMPHNVYSRPTGVDVMYMFNDSAIYEGRYQRIPWVKHALKFNAGLLFWADLLLGTLSNWRTQPCAAPQIMHNSFS